MPSLTGARRTNIFITRAAMSRRSARRVRRKTECPCTSGEIASRASAEDRETIFLEKGERHRVAIEKWLIAVQTLILASASLVRLVIDLRGVLGSCQ